MSYINIVGNGVTQTSYTSYKNYPLDNTVNNPLLLAWSTQFIDTPYIVAGFTDITATTAAPNLVRLPSAINTSTGTKVTFGNPGANAYTVQDNDGNPLLTIAPGQAWNLVLTDNTTAHGTWRTFPHAGGYAAITSINAVAQNAGGQIMGNIVITGTPGLPITTAGTIEVNLGNDLQALTALPPGPGYAYKTGVNTWQLVTITGNTPITVVANPLNPTNIQIGINPGLWVTSVTASVPDATNAANLVITGSPITGAGTGAGTLDFAFAADLRALVNFGTATGIARRRGAGDWVLDPVVVTTGTSVRFNGVTAGPLPQVCAIMSQANVATVTHTAVGIYTVAFTSPVANNNYVVTGNVGNGVASFISYGAATTTGVEISVYTSNTAALVDATDVSIAITLNA